MDFQVQEQTYFLTLADDDTRWEVLVETPTGARPVPVYVDAEKFGSVVVFPDEKQRLPN